MAQARRSHEERRAEIVEAALRLIATRGITALTVAALANELGLTGGALYRHFPSTDAILDAVAERAVSLLDASLPDPSLEPLLWLERFVDSRARAVSGQAGLARLIFSEQLAMALPESALERLRGAVRHTFVAVERALRSAQERGEIRIRRGGAGSDPDGHGRRADDRALAVRRPAWSGGGPGPRLGHDARPAHAPLRLDFAPNPSRRQPVLDW